MDLIFDCKCRMPRSDALNKHFKNRDPDKAGCYRLTCPKHPGAKLIGQTATCQKCGESFEVSKLAHNVKYCDGCRKSAQLEKTAAWHKAHKDGLIEYNKARYWMLKSPEPEPPIDFDYPVPERPDRGPCAGCGMERMAKDNQVCDNCKLKTAYCRCVEYAEGI